MSDLFEKSMRTLELPAVLEMLAQRAVSDEAKRRCENLRLWSMGAVLAGMVLLLLS